MLYEVITINNYLFNLVPVVELEEGMKPHNRWTYNWLSFAQFEKSADESDGVDWNRGIYKILPIAADSSFDLDLFLKHRLKAHPSADWAWFRNNFV